MLRTGRIRVRIAAHYAGGSAQHRAERKRPATWVVVFGSATLVSGSVKLQGTVRFGEDCELDLRAYELRRGGRPLKLERIPMQILLFLIEHRNELVRREQIVERIGGKDVFLDTDNSINGAIRKIRQALRDDPEVPRFVQTITGQGYRFIADVIASEDGPTFTRPQVALSDSHHSPSILPVSEARNRSLRFLLFVAGV